MGLLQRLTKALLPLFCSLIPINGYAMHIAEGFLPPAWCGLWSLLFLPLLVLGFRTLKKAFSTQPDLKMLYAVAAAFVFILSSLKMPSVAGSSSHMTGIALGALLFGAFSMPVIGLIVLLFQALLLAHGGLTTLGANAFSMAVVGAFVAVWSYKAFGLLNGPKWLPVFMAAFLSDISIYCCTSLQLALAFQTDSAPFVSNLYKFLSLFALAQVPLAIIEGMLTVMLLKLIQRYHTSDVETKLFAHV